MNDDYNTLCEQVTQLRTAADHGDPTAWHHLAIMHEDGRGVAQDIVMAMELHRKSVTAMDKRGGGSIKGWYDSISDLRYILMGDYPKSEQCLRMGLFRERQERYNAAAAYYRHGIGLDCTDDAVRYWLHNNLAYCLCLIDNCKEAEQFALAAIEINADLHNAFKNMGMTLHGQGRYDEAAQYYYKAATKAPLDDRAFTLLQDLHVKHAQELKRPAEVLWMIEQTNKERLVARAIHEPQACAYDPEAEAIAVKGVALLKGDGVPVDLVEAEKLFRQAAEKGNAYAMCCLGIMYAHGCQVVKNLEEAKTWLEGAANAGEPRQLNSLGHFFLVARNGNDNPFNQKNICCDDMFITPTGAFYAHAEKQPTKETIEAIKAHQKRIGLVGLVGLDSTGPYHDWGFDMLADLVKAKQCYLREKK